MKAFTKWIAMLLTLALCLGCMAGCSGGAETPETTPPTTPSSEPATDVVDDTTAEVGLTTGLWSYCFDNEGTVYDTYFKFYDNGVFYYSTMHGGVILIGTYEAKDEPYTGDHGATREDVLNDIKTHYELPQTMYFYDMAGNEIGKVGYQEKTVMAGLTLQGNISFSEGIVLNHEPASVPGEGDYAEEFGQAVAHYYDPADPAVAFIDIMHNGTFQDLVGDMMKEGTWTKDGNTYTLTEDGETDTYTLVVDGATATYTDVDGNAKTLETEVATEGGEAEVLFSWNSGSDTILMDCYADGTYKFSFTSYNIEEVGTWTWAGWTFTFTSAAGQEFVATMDDAHALNVHFVADASDQLAADFTCGADVWGTAFAGEGDYTPVSAAPAEALLKWNIEGDWLGLECYADGTYKFTYADYNLEEVGTWTWAGWSFKFVSPAGTEFVATMDEAHALVVEFHADASEQLGGTFTCGSDIWGTAFAGEGDYTPAG